MAGHLAAVRKKMHAAGVLMRRTLESQGLTPRKRWVGAQELTLLERSHIREPVPFPPETPAHDRFPRIYSVCGFFIDESGNPG